MADDGVIAAVGLALERALSAALAAAPGLAATATLTRAEALRPGAAPAVPGVAIVLLDVGPDAVVRSATRGAAPAAAYALRYLLLPHGDDAAHEHRILGRALAALERTPVLAGDALLPASDGWAPDDAVELIVERAPTEAVLALLASVGAPHRPAVGVHVRVRLPRA